MMAINSVSTFSARPDGVSLTQQETAAEDFATALATAREEKSEKESRSDSYVVRSGDSLYRIAGFLKNTLNLPIPVTTLVREMTALNNLQNPNLIFPGQVLQLPAVATNPAPPNLPAAVINPPPPPVSSLNAVAPIKSIPEITATPVPRSTVAKLDFPLFIQQGNMILPAVIRDFRFSTPDESTAEPSPGLPSETQPLTMTAGSGETPATPIAETKAQPHHNLETQMAMYKEDQLLAHPGGDYYFLRRSENIFDPLFDQSRFVNRVGKDLADAGENMLNIAKNLALGAQYKYISERGEIKSSQQVGLLGTLKNFIEDVFSGLSFGAYVPEGEKAPDGVLPSVGHFFKKILYEAPIRDLLIGIPHVAVNVVKDAALASLNLLEVIPDATIGNFEWGQKATTTVFDNGQVVVDYLTDVLPGGNAWLRVHAAGPLGDIEPPIYFNLTASEQGITDSRWASVRNTPFRKTIETIGSLLSDAAVIAIAARSYSPSSDQRHDY